MDNSIEDIIKAVIGDDTDNVGSSPVNVKRRKQESTGSVILDTLTATAKIMANTPARSKPKLPAMASMESLAPNLPTSFL